MTMILGESIVAARSGAALCRNGSIQRVAGATSLYHE
jgi:hypothetical protein